MRSFSLFIAKLMRLNCFAGTNPKCKATPVIQYAYDSSHEFMGFPHTYLDVVFSLGCPEVLVVLITSFLTCVCCHWRNIGMQWCHRGAKWLSWMATPSGAQRQTALPREDGHPNHFLAFIFFFHPPKSKGFHGHGVEKLG